MTTTSETNSVATPKRNLAVFDLLNGATVIGESTVGFDRYSVINPARLVSEKGEKEGEVKVGLSPIPFAAGTVYRIESSAVLASYQCFDPSVHEIYNRALTGGNADGGGNKSE